MDSATPPLTNHFQGMTGVGFTCRKYPAAATSFTIDVELAEAWTPQVGRGHVKGACVCVVQVARVCHAHVCKCACMCAGVCGSGAHVAK